MFISFAKVRLLEILPRKRKLSLTCLFGSEAFNTHKDTGQIIINSEFFDTASIFFFSKYVQLFTMEIGKY